MKKNCKEFDIEKLKRGDKNEWKKFAEFYQVKVADWLRYKWHNASTEDCEDIFQTAMTELFLHISEGKAIRKSLHGLLYQIAHNKAYDKFVKPKSDPPISLDHNKILLTYFLFTPKHISAKTAINSEIIKAYYDCLEKLDAFDQRCLYLKYRVDKKITYKEMAEDLFLFMKIDEKPKEDKVRYHLKKAKISMRNCLKNKKMKEYLEEMD